MSPEVEGPRKSRAFNPKVDQVSSKTNKQNRTEAMG